jgi:hypothetical protein
MKKINFIYFNLYVCSVMNMLLRWILWFIIASSTTIIYHIFALNYWYLNPVGDFNRFMNLVIGNSLMVFIATGILVSSLYSKKYYLPVSDAPFLGIVGFGLITMKDNPKYFFALSIYIFVLIISLFFMLIFTELLLPLFFTTLFVTLIYIFTAKTNKK